MAREKTPEKAPEPVAAEPVDLRSALAAAIRQERVVSDAVLVLRGAVEAEGRLRPVEQRATLLEQRATELETELPTLVKRVEVARAQAAAAEQQAQAAYSEEARKARAALDELHTRIAAERHAHESDVRAQQAAYDARRKQLTDELGDLERRLEKVREEWVQLVSKHAPR